MAAGCRCEACVFTGIGLVGITAALGAVLQQPADLSRRRQPHGARRLAQRRDAVTRCSTCCRCSVAFIVIALGALALRGGRPDSIAPLVFGLLGAADGVRRHRRQRALPHRRPRLAGTVFEEGTWLYVVYGGGARRRWARSPTGVRSCGVGGSPTSRRCRSPLSGFIAHRARRAAVPRRRLRRQPAGQRRREFDYSGPQNLWNVLAAVGHVLMFVTVLAFVGLAAAVVHARATTPATTRGTARRSSGRPSSPAPYDNFAEVHIVCVGRTAARPQATE